MTVSTHFSDFKVGAIAVFNQRFEQEEFEAFSRLSGDNNPLHSDKAYATNSEFNLPIVPLHMTIAPLSRIAGMIFPGDPSLYLGHEVRSILPVFYGDELSYSARVTGVNEAMRTLTIRVLIIRGTDVLVDSKMWVQSRLEEWVNRIESLDLSPPNSAALVTGATGEIGSALAVDLAMRGHDLVLVDRGPGAKREALNNKLSKFAMQGQSIDYIAADMTKADDVEAMCNQIIQRGNLSSVFHAASPPIIAELYDLVQVNYAALQKISEATLPAMLLRQEGVLSNVGSIATERVIPDWHDYSAAKAMAGQFLSAFDKLYSEFGVRGLNILSGLVETAYSKSAQGTSTAMTATELAQHVTHSALHDKAGRALIIEWSGKRAGAVGFQADRRAKDASHAAPDTISTETAPVSVSEGAVETLVADVLRRRFDLPIDTDISLAGVGQTAGWDSLRHIELVLELENVIGIRFNAKDVEHMMTYRSLVETTKNRLNSS